MSTLFNANNIGCFKSPVTLDTSKGRGTKLVADGGQIPADTASDLIIVGFNYTKKEAVAILQCFNDASFIYAFGDNIEESIFGVKLIGSLTSDSKALITVNDFYKKNRIKEATQPVEFSYGASRTLTGYLIAMTTNTADAQHGMQNIDLSLIMTGY